MAKNMTTAWNQAGQGVGQVMQRCESAKATGFLGKLLSILNLTFLYNSRVNLLFRSIRLFFDVHN